MTVRSSRAKPTEVAKSKRYVAPDWTNLDERPAEIRPKILARLNDVAADPLILTCRSLEHQSPVAALGRAAVPGGAVIEPSRLTPADAARYISGCLPPRT